MTLIKVSINCLKRTDGFWQLIESSNKVIFRFLKFLKKCKNEEVRFWQLIESLK
jgi:hypothetical protein